MKSLIKKLHLFACFALTLHTGLTTAQLNIEQPAMGHRIIEQSQHSCTAHELYDALDAETNRNITQLKSEGKLIFNAGKVLLPQTFEWPLTYETNFLGNDYFFIQNYVDHDTTTGSISEFMCGTRSYDLASGYDHQGTDICIGPYWWNMMDDMKVRIIAAAPGQIIGKADGNFDRNCGFGAGAANSITIQHADGTRALYLHMKNGSVTTKVVGDYVETGEFLGYVGSSGSSTNPHLHFEVRNAANQFIDPWAGPCNDDITSSLWNNQKPYPNSGIMSILTMSAVPTVPACPNPETVPLTNHFEPGDPMRIEIHLRDLMPGTSFELNIFDPNNVIIDNATVQIANFLAGGFYFTTPNISNNAIQGTYRVEVTYQGKRAAHYYTVGCPAAYNLSGSIGGFQGYLSGSNITSTQSISGSGGNNIWYEAETYIEAKTGFRAKAGCHFRARIDNCSNNGIRQIDELNANPMLSLQAHPTITATTTKLKVSTNKNSKLNLVVFDLTGRQIKPVITNQNLPDGVHEFELNTTDMAPGIYICTAVVDALKTTCKIIVQR
ncbi:MAG: peptidoglycan DD-metalloendopeptidase family protein [Bacteroidia bacterium]|nr:peptidoglycan DD-metalloendopeptidase family protein [Bacteroidia bacterium]HQU99851.1 peptidoglycan DD-metalloendopeptidase family protein [Bacteroidia bacterium]